MTNNELLLLIRLICYGRGGGGPGESEAFWDHMVVRGNSRLKQILKEGL